MSERVRIYHPETGEPFDVTALKASDLVLNKGWLKHPIDKDAEPYVRTVGTETGTSASQSDDALDWRNGETKPIKPRGRAARRTQSIETE